MEVNNVNPSVQRTEDVKRTSENTESAPPPKPAYKVDISQEAIDRNNEERKTKESANVEQTQEEVARQEAEEPTPEYVEPEDVSG